MDDAWMDAFVDGFWKRIYECILCPSMCVCICVYYLYSMDGKISKYFFPIDIFGCVNVSMHRWRD